MINFVRPVIVPLRVVFDFENYYWGKRKGNDSVDVLSPPRSSVRGGGGASRLKSGHGNYDVSFVTLFATSLVNLSSIDAVAGELRRVLKRY